jgi:hypothetical protein
MAVAPEKRDVGAEIRAYINEVGGLASLMDLAREWGISKARVHEIAKRPDFPAPVAEVAAGTSRAIALYSRAQAQAYRDTPRKPGPKPRNAGDGAS